MLDTLLLLPSGYLEPRDGWATWDQCPEARRDCSATLKSSRFSSCMQIDGETVDTYSSIVFLLFPAVICKPSRSSWQRFGRSGKVGVSVCGLCKGTPTIPNYVIVYTVHIQRYTYQIMIQLTSYRPTRPNYWTTDASSILTRGEHCPSSLWTPSLYRHLSHSHSLREMCTRMAL